MNITVSEFTALSLVLNSITVKDLLHNAMVGFSNDDNTKAQENADVCSQAINTFLM